MSQSERRDWIKQEVSRLAGEQQDQPNYRCVLLVRERVGCDKGPERLWSAQRDHGSHLLVVIPPIIGE